MYREAMTMATNMESKFACGQNVMYLGMRGYVIRARMYVAYYETVQGGIQYTIRNAWYYLVESATDQRLDPSAPIHETDIQPI